MEAEVNYEEEDEDEDDKEYSVVDRRKQKRAVNPYLDMDGGDVSDEEEDEENEHNYYDGFGDGWLTTSSLESTHQYGEKHGVVDGCVCL